MRLHLGRLRLGDVGIGTTAHAVGRKLPLQEAIGGSRLRVEARREDRVGIELVGTDVEASADLARVAALIEYHS